MKTYVPESQSGEKPGINYHIIEIIIFGDTVTTVTYM